MKTYVHTTGKLRGRRYIATRTAGGSRTTKLYSRAILEELLGQPLPPNTHVDHIDGDSTNDSIDNLQVLTSSEHGKKTAAQLGRSISLYTGTCPLCGIVFSKQERNVKHNIKQGKSGPYCSRSCAGKSSNTRGTTSEQ